jgi:hypothetical protein
MEDIGKIAGFVLTGIVIVYIAFLFISEFSKITPEFSRYGWYIFGALLTVFVGGVYLIFRGK